MSKCFPVSDMGQDLEPKSLNTSDPWSLTGGICGRSEERSDAPRGGRRRTEEDDRGTTSQRTKDQKAVIFVTAALIETRG